MNRSSAINVAIPYWILLSLFLTWAPVASSRQDVRELTPGQHIEREMKGGEAHSYRVPLAAGQFLRIAVEQRGVDVVTKLFGPDAQFIAEMDTPTGREGTEPISMIATVTGEYRVEIQANEKDAPVGRYDVWIEDLREATPEDHDLIAAEQAQIKGQQLVNQGTAESFRQAIQVYEDAILHWRAVGDPLGESDAVNNIGWIYSALGDREKALVYFNRALPLIHEVGDREREASLLNNIGYILDTLGEPQKALESYNQTLILRRVIKDRRGEALTLNNIGLVYHELGEPQKALDYYTQSLPLRREVGDRRGEANTLNSICWAYADLGEKEKALEYAHQALPLARDVGDRDTEAVILNSLGLLSRTQVEPETTLNYFNQALQLWRLLGSRVQEAMALGNIGLIHEESGESEKALEYYNQALALQRAVKDRTNEAKTLYRIAYVKSNQGQLVEALTQLETALDMVESLRTKVGSQELRASLLASRQDYYELHIDLLMRLHQREPKEGHAAAALQASERFRARSLLELLMEAHADIQQGADPMLLETARVLQRRLNTKSERLTELLSGSYTEEQKSTAEKELDQLLTQYQEVQAQIRSSSPRYAALTQPQPLSLKEIQQQTLDDHTMWLEYALGHERSFLWAVTPTSLTSYELPKRAEIETVARRAYDLMIARNHVVKFETMAERRRRIAQADTEYEEAAVALSQILLGPVSGQLGTKRLLIVADGVLQYIPFGALPVPNGRTEDSGLRTEMGRPKNGGSLGPPSTSLGPGFVPLIVRHEIVSLPSASVLSVLRRELAGRPPATEAVAVFADPVFQSTDIRIKRKRTEVVKQTNETDGWPSEVARSAGESGVTNFQRLRFSRVEADGITALAATKGFKAVDFAANKASAISVKLNQYRIIHFATHGLLNSQHPELSGLVLSLVDETGKPQDGFLRLNEVYNLKLNADLVVLSACQTALGKEIKGEGLVGLTRGFMYAGAAQVMASLWSIQDKATAELMKRCYQEMLIKGQRPAAALRTAQIAMWKEKHLPPYYWAAFTLQGEWK